METVDGAVFATRTFLVQGGTQGLSSDEVIDRVEETHRNVRLYSTFALRAAPYGVGLVMVQVSAQVSLLPLPEAVAFVRGLAVDRFPQTCVGEWGVVDGAGRELTV